MALTALVAVSWTSTASAHGLNRRSDRAAMRAYNRYLGAIITRTTIGAGRDDAFLTAVHSGCLGYLKPFAGEITSSAGHALGVELGADLAIRFTSANGRPLRRLARRLTQLTWSRPDVTAAVASFVTAEHQLVRLRTSRLCSDVIRLGYHPSYVSRRTRRFDHHFQEVTANASQALSGFIAVLQRYEHRDRRLVLKIDRRAATYQRIADSIEGTDQTTLIHDLGLQTLS